MEIQNACKTPSKSNQLRNVNTVRWESWNITTQPGGIDDRKSEVIVFVVNADVNIFKCCQLLLYLDQGKKFLCLKYLLWSTKVPLDIYQAYVFSNSGLSMLNISSRYREVSLNMYVYKVILFRFVKVRHNIPLMTKLKTNPAMSGAHFVPIGIPTICWYTMSSNCTYMFSMRKVKASHNAAGSPTSIRVILFVAKKPALSKVQRYVFDSLLKHQLTKRQHFSLNKIMWQWGV